jgi:hypothetical protein
MELLRLLLLVVVVVPQMHLIHTAKVVLVEQVEEGVLQIHLQQEELVVQQIEVALEEAV